MQRYKKNPKQRRFPEIYLLSPVLVGGPTIKSILGFFFILYKKPSLFKNVYLLLERQQLFGISHKRINKKMSRPGTLHSLRTRSGGGFY